MQATRATNPHWNKVIRANSNYYVKWVEELLKGTWVSADLLGTTKPTPPLGCFLSFEHLFIQLPPHLPFHLLFHIRLRRCRHTRYIHFPNRNDLDRDTRARNR